MTNSNCSIQGGCVLSLFWISLLVGVVAAILSFLGIITLFPALLLVIFGVSLGYLFLAPIILLFIRNTMRVCISSVVPALITGIVGTVLLSLVLLIIDVSATSIIGAILTGLTLLFLVLTIVSNIYLINCITRNSVYSNN